MTDEPQVETTNEDAQGEVETLLTDEPKLDFSEGRPEDFPEDFWDAENNAPNTAKLYDEYKRADKIAKDLRVKLGKGEFTGKAPQDVSEYVLENADDYKDILGDDDPVFDAAKQAALDAGMPVEAFNKFMAGVLPKIGELSQQQPSEEQMQAEFEEYRKSELEKLGPSANAMVRANNDFIDEIVSMGLISPELKNAAKSMVTNADQLRVMNALRSVASRNRENVNIDVPVDAKASKADLERKLAKAASSRNVEEYNKISAQLAALAS